MLVKVGFKDDLEIVLFGGVIVIYFGEGVVVFGIILKNWCVIKRVVWRLIFIVDIKEEVRRFFFDNLSR